mgnify:CR=1 FL=1
MSCLQSSQWCTGSRRSRAPCFRAHLHACTHARWCAQCPGWMGWLVRVHGLMRSMAIAPQYILCTPGGLSARQGLLASAIIGACHPSWIGPIMMSCSNSHHFLNPACNRTHNNPSDPRHSSSASLDHAPVYQPAACSRSPRLSCDWPNRRTSCPKPTRSMSAVISKAFGVRVAGGAEQGIWCVMGSFLCVH